MLQKLIIVFVSFIYAHCQCRSSLQLNTIQSNSATFLPTPEANGFLTFQYQYGQGFTVIPTIAISIKGFEVRVNQLLNWQVRTGAITQTSSQFLFNYQIDKWVSLNVGFVISSHPQLYLGQFSVIEFDSQLTTIQIGKNIQNYQGSVARTFINGFLSTNTSERVLINVRGVRVLENGLRLRIQKNIILQSLRLSYIIFNPKLVEFASYGGGFFLRNFSSSRIYQLHRSIYYPSALIEGLVSFELSGQEPLTLSSFFTARFVLGISTTRPFQNLVFSYIVFGVPPLKTCQNCTQSVIFNQFCLNVCPPNTYQFTYRDGGQGCRQCQTSLGYILNIQTKTCICRPGFEEREGYCQRVEDAVDFQLIQLQRRDYINNNCSSVPNTYWTGYRCACKVGFKSRNRRCGAVTLDDYIQEDRPPSFVNELPVIDRCQQLPNQKPLDGRCVCVQNFFRTIQGNCQACPRFSTSVNEECACNEGFNQEEGKCIKICPSNSQDKGQGFCECNQGFIQQGQLCECPLNRVDDGSGRCLCKEGFIEQGQSCICLQNSTDNEQGECICNEGFQRNQALQCELICNQSQTLINGSCQCIEGLVRIDGVCRRCPSGFLLIEGECVSLCGSRQLYSLEQERCVCEDGFGYFNKRCIVCPDGFFIVGGYCATCPFNSQLRNQQGQCVCDVGFIDSGSCSKICERNQVYLPSTNACRCRVGLGLQNGECGICEFGVAEGTCKTECNTTSEVLEGGRCTCREGFGLIQGCVNCSSVSRIQVSGYCAICPLTFTIINNTCACRLGSVERQGRCISNCSENQILIDGQCTPCSQFQINVDNVCQCQIGYQLVDGRCSLICQTNAFNVDGVCMECPQNQIFTEGQCKCDVGFINNNGTCQRIQTNCLPGFYLSQGVCLRCPIGCSLCQSEINCTECLQGYVLINDSCLIAIVNGNGVLESGQECDDGNTLSGDGCFNGELQLGFVCEGQPSTCVRTQQFSLEAQISSLSPNTAIIEARTDPAFTFNSQEQMRSFMSIGLNQPAISSCLQQSEERFICMLFFREGLPDGPLNVQLSYNVEQNGRNNKVTTNLQINAFTSSRSNLRQLV